MKKIFTFLIAGLPLVFMNAQVIFEQNFESGMAPMTLVDNDGHTPAANVAAYNLAWNIANPTFGNGTNVAISNSWYTPAAAADDWMITPAIAIPAVADNVLLQWEAKAQDASYPDGYQVRISTTGTALADFTNVAFSIPSEMPTWQARGVSLAAYAGQTIYIAFRNNSTDQFLLLMDNISVASVQANDVSVVKLTNKRYALTGDVSITGEIKNYGSSPLTSFDATWNDGTTDHTQTITLTTPLLYGQSVAFTHPTPLSATQAKGYNITLTVSNPNGATDGDLTNNSTSGSLITLSYAPTKKMFVEEATGTWCGWCPRGTEWMDFMAENYPDDFIGVAVHNADPMTVTEYDAGLNGFPGFAGYPSVIVDRAILDDPDQLEILLPSVLDRLVPANIPTVAASLDVATRTLTVDASTSFATNISNHDFRFNLVLTEDAVKGTGAGYNQTNYYAGAAAPTDPIPGFGQNWDDLTDPVPAADMTYNHVGRLIQGGYLGTAGSIPATAAVDEVVSKSYTINNFNTSWNPFNMHAVMLVLDNVNGEVANVNSVDIDVICPNDFGAVTTVTPSSNGSNGEIALTPPSNTFGFGGYTYLWSSGQTTGSITGLTPGTYTLTISDKIGCTQSLDVVVQSSSSVEDIASLKSFSLSPNPASSVSVLSASFAKNVDLSIEVVNVEGKVVATVSFDNTASVNHSFDLSDFAEGMYLVKMNVGGQVHTERLMVTK